MAEDVLVTTARLQKNGPTPSNPKVIQEIEENVQAALENLSTVTIISIETVVEPAE